jgi:hypothetical protein
MTTLLEMLRSVDPSLGFLAIEAGDRDGEFIRMEDLIQAWRRDGLTVRVVRGDKMRTLEGLFDEFAAAWQFPLFFGRNKDAFDDCMRNLPQVSGRGLIVVIVKPDEVLAEEGLRELEWLVRTLTSAAAAWGEPIESGEWWDRPAAPFHTVLDIHTRAGARAVERWAQAGASLSSPMRGPSSEAHSR